MRKGAQPRSIRFAQPNPKPMNNDKTSIEPQESKGPDQERDSIWNSAFDTASGAGAAPPPFQLSADPLAPLDQSAADTKGGLTREQMALVESLGMGAILPEMTDEQQARLSAFLGDFASQARTTHALGGGSTSVLQKDGQYLRLSTEYLPGGRVRKTTEYSFGPHRFKNVTMEGEPAADAPQLAQPEEIAVALEGLSESFPGKGSVKVLEDVLHKYGHSTVGGPESRDFEKDRHLGYSRVIEVATADGRRVYLTLRGRTELAGSTGGPAGLDLPGQSFLSLDFYVSGPDGKQVAETYAGEGNSLNEAIPGCAAEGGFDPVLLRPGPASAAFMDAVIEKANTLIPPVPATEVPEGERVEQEQPGLWDKLRPDIEVPDEKKQGPKDKGREQEKPLWSEMTPEQKRGEAWGEFSKEFSWGGVATGVAIGLGIFGVAALVPAAIPLLGVAAIIGAILMLAIPISRGEMPDLPTWIKAGLLGLVGVFTILATIAASPEIVAGLIITGVALVAVAVVEAIVSYVQGINAPTREGMQDKARQSAHQAEQAISDIIVTILSAKGVKKMIDKWLKRGPGRSGMDDDATPPRDEDANAPREDEPLARDEDAATRIAEPAHRNSLGLPAIERTRIRFRQYRRNPEEFNRQMELQERGLNELTVEEYLANRDRYLLEGRSAEGDRAQRDYRSQARDEKVFELTERHPDLSDEEIATMADEWMDTQAVLHDPDQVAGGDPFNITGMGDRRVNSSLGSQWAKREPGSAQTRADALDNHIRGIAAGMTPEEKASTYLNVDLNNL